MSVQPQDLAESPATSWSHLKDALESNSYDRGLEIIAELVRNNKTLKNDKDIIQCKVHCYIQTGKFQEAHSLIKTIKTTCPSLFKSLAFENAYCLYKLNFFKESFYAIRSIRHPEMGDVTAVKSTNDKTDDCRFYPVNFDRPNDEKFSLLEAQLLYRIGLYKESAELYKQFLCHDEDDVLTNVNYQACLVGLGNSSKNDNPLTLDSCREANSHELSFNAACLELEVGRIDKARQFLELAEEQCNETINKIGTETNCTVEDLDMGADFILIRTQKAYIDQLEGELTKAADFYHTIVPMPKQPPTPDDDADSTLLSVIINNLAVIENSPSLVPLLRGISMWILKKQMLASNELPAPKHSQGINNFSRVYRNSTSLKLTRQQIIPLIKNRCLVMLHDNRYRECERYLQSLPNTSFSLAQLFAWLKMQEGQYLEASELLEKAAQKHTDTKNTVHLRLCALIALLRQGHIERARQLIHTITGKQLVEGYLNNEVLPVVLQLYKKISSSGLNNILAFVKRLVLSVTEGQQEILSLNSDALIIFGDIFAERQLFKISYKCYTLAGKILEKKQQTDIRIIAGCLKMAARFDFPLAQITLKELQRESSTIFEDPTLTLIDPEDIEQLPVPITRQTMKTGGVTFFKFINESRLMESAWNNISEKNGGGESVINIKSGTKQRHRKKKKRFPKNFDPENPGNLPDPERWIPKHERMTFKKSKRGNIKTFRGAQGIMPISYANDTGAKKVTASTANVEIKKDIKRRVNRRNRK